ncbi:unnamed protein product, partial [Rhizoctonia solani]
LREDPPSQTNQQEDDEHLDRPGAHGPNVGAIWRHLKSIPGPPRRPTYGKPCESWQSLPHNEADACFSNVGTDAYVAGTSNSCQELYDTQPVPRTLGSFGRQTLGFLTKLTDNIGVVPGLSHIVGAFEKLQNEIEDQEARFGRHLDALLSIIEPHIQVASHAQKNTNALSNSNLSLLELQNLIGSVRKTLFGRTVSTASPYSHLLSAKKHQRNFEEATDSFRNWTNEWIIQTVTNLAKKFEGLESRVHRLDDRIQGLNNFVQRIVPL